jgi:microsomal dipeptidase-like Zn-dependent dipeptidase
MIMGGNMSLEGNSLWKEIHDEAIIFDLHTHQSIKVSLIGRLITLNNKASKYSNPFSFRTDIPKLIKGRVNGVSSAIYAPEPAFLEDCKWLRLVKTILPGMRRAFSKSPFGTTIALMDEIEKAVEEAKDPNTGRPLAKFAYSVQELNEILSQGNDGPVAFVHSVEGAHSLDENIDNLDKLFERGVNHLTMAHFYENGIAPPVYPFPEYVQKLGCFQMRRDLTLGLTPLGKDVVEKMIEIGMIIDITHCTPKARQQIYDMVGNKTPIIASHIGVFDMNPNPYNLEDWEIRKIADTGGAVGVIFMNYWLVPYERVRGLDYISQTIRHIMEVTGDDYVAIGSDFDGFTDPPDDIKDASEMPHLTQRLVSDGLTREQIFKILGDNALRVLREGWGKK